LGYAYIYGPDISPDGEHPSAHMADHAPGAAEYALKAVASEFTENSEHKDD
jgi:hypothetical protein